jgi:hypothetical protein
VLQDAIGEIRTILERFANGKSMDIITEAFSALRNDAQNDEELREWFERVDAYVRKVRTQFRSGRCTSLMAHVLRSFSSLAMF